MSHYSEVFSRLGLTFVEPVFDGNIHRVSEAGKRNDVGWYIANDVPFKMVTIGNWKTGKKETWKEIEKFKSQRQEKEFKKIMLDNAAIVKQEKLKEQGQVSEEAVKLWAGAISGDHPYYERKKIAKHGTKVSGDTILVPMYDIDGKLWGIQRILPTGKKKFLKGQRAKALYFIIGKPIKDEVYVCEGFATGATIYETTGCTTVVCFFASNLKPVCLAIADRFPGIKITICADNDQFTDNNPGLKEAEETAKLVGCNFVYPKFKDLTNKPTDFNDLFVLYGTEETAEQILNIDISEPFSALGIIENTYFFYCTKERIIRKINNLDLKNICLLAPSSFWEERFPPEEDSHSKIDYHKITDYLVRACVDKGTFDYSKVRGAGVWKDSDRVVINSSTHLLVDGVKREFHQFKTKYIYASSSQNQAMIFTHLSSLNKEEGKYLTDAIAGFKWLKSEHKYLVAGWIAIARIAGALPVRPHMWITGPSQSGKTTLIEDVIQHSLGSGFIHVSGNTTEAGVRQQVKCDSLPLIFDEFESNGTNNYKIQSVIELMRQAWSDSNSVIIKGGPGGFVSVYRICSPALFSSIRVALSNDADISRFCVVELLNHGGDRAHWIGLKERINMLDHNYGDRLFKRSIAMLDTILKSYEVLNGVLRSGLKTRQAQQYGMLLAGYWSLVSDLTITVEEAQEFMTAIGTEEIKLEEEADEFECFEHILSSIVTVSYQSYDEKSTNVTKNISNLLDSGYVEGLQNFGIKRDGDRLIVHPKNAALLKHVMEGTRWKGCLRRTLLRLPGSRRITSRIGGISYECVEIHYKLQEITENINKISDVI